MNRTETTEENEWREASHPRLVKRLDDQREALAQLNRQVQTLTADLTTMTNRLRIARDDAAGLQEQRDTALAKVAELQAKIADLIEENRENADFCAQYR